MVDLKSSLLVLAGILFVGIVLPVLLCSIARVYFLVRYNGEFQRCLDAINRDDQSVIDEIKNTHLHYYIGVSDGQMFICSNDSISILDIR